MVIFPSWLGVPSMFHAVMGMRSLWVGREYLATIRLLMKSPSAPESMSALVLTILLPRIMTGINNDVLFGMAVIIGEICTLGSRNVAIRCPSKNPLSPMHRRLVHVAPGIVLQIAP